MMRKILIGLLISGVIALAVALFVGPFVAARGLIQAARAGDEQGLARHVDFPALRTSLKAELNARAVMEIRDRTGGDRGMAALGMLLAPSLVSGAVDAVVTPQGVAAMVRAARAPDLDQPAPPADTPAAPREKLHQAWAYRGFDRFAVTLTRDDRPGEVLVLVLERRGVFGWKLAGVDLTPDPMA